MGARGPLGVFFAASAEQRDAGARADWNIGWGSTPTDLASKVPKFQSDLQLSHGPC